jgi:hypothetical protein
MPFVGSGKNRIQAINSGDVDFGAGNRTAFNRKDREENAEGA